MKFATLLPLFMALSQSSAFAPHQPRAFARPSVVTFMSEEETAPESKGALVLINEETIEFTAGLIGGSVGLIIGGPVVAALGAAAANYVSKSDNDVGDIVGTVSKSAIEIYNYLASLDGKYEILNKAKGSLESALTKLKSQQSVDPAAVEKVEKALASTKAKIAEVNDEYDLVGAGVTALGVIGDLVEKTVKKVSELNEEYSLTEKAKDALDGAVSKAKEAQKKL
jgi:hypothetical protein